MDLSVFPKRRQTSLKMQRSESTIQCKKPLIADNSTTKISIFKEDTNEEIKNSVVKCKKLNSLENLHNFFNKKTVALKHKLKGRC